MGSYETAREGERIAAEHLSCNGCTILHRNWRCPHGEVDLIAQEGTTILFVEVKARRRVNYSLPREAVDERKQFRLRQCADLYLSLFYPHGACRFDVVEVWWRANRVYVSWIRDAF